MTGPFTDFRPGDFDGYDAGVKRAQTGIQNNANVLAGNALARGDYQTGANVFYRSGMIDKGIDVQDQQYRQQAREKAQADAQRKEQLDLTQRAIDTLDNVARNGGDIIAEFDNIARTFEAMEPDPARKPQVRQGLMMVREGLGKDPAKVLALMRQATQKEAFTLSEGQRRYDGAGRLIAEGPTKPETPFAMDPDKNYYMREPTGTATTDARGNAVPPPPPSPSTNSYRDAIANIESRGSGDYKALGPVTRTGDRAYGKYQVMGANIPQWTKEILGQSMTPAQFLASPEAQDKVFDAKFGGYAKQYGSPEDAASMWFTGKPRAQGANRRDVNGMSGSQYVQRFSQNMGQVSGAQGTSTPPGIQGGSGSDTVGAPQVPGYRMIQQASRSAGGHMASPDEKKALGISAPQPVWINKDGKPDVINDGQGGMSPKEQRQSSIALRKEFDQHPDVKAFQTVATSFDVVSRLATAKPTAPNDVSMIFAYMKILDPTSVVREGEFATAQNTVGIPGQVMNAYNKALNGQRLNPEQRKQFVEAASRIYSANKGRYDQLVTQYQGYSTELGLPATTIQPRLAVAAVGAGEGAKKPDGWSRALTPAQRATAQHYSRATGAPGSIGRPYAPVSAVEYDGLPPGAHYIHSSGAVKVKP